MRKRFSSRLVGLVAGSAAIFGSSGAGCPGVPGPVSPTPSDFEDFFVRPYEFYEGDPTDPGVPPGAAIDNPEIIFEEKTFNATQSGYIASQDENFVSSDEDSRQLRVEAYHFYSYIKFDNESLSKLKDHEIESAFLIMPLRDDEETENSNPFYSSWGIVTENWYQSSLSWNEQPAYNFESYLGYDRSDINTITTGEMKFDLMKPKFNDGGRNKTCLDIWINAPEKNHGLILIGRDVDLTDQGRGHILSARTFNSSRTANPPRLEIKYKTQREY